MSATNFTPIQLYRSTTAAAVPLAANLASGELAINVTDGKLYYNDSGVVKVIAGTGGTGVVAGSNTQLQFNNSGVFGASASLTWNGTSLAVTGTLAVTGATTLSSTLAVTGITTVAAGSAALPAIVSTTGTADTGLWFPAADTIAASTAGTERLRIDSSGNVGIGTTSPSAPVDVVSNSSAIGTRIRGRSADNYGVLEFTNNGASAETARLAADTSGNIVFANTGSVTERMRIDSSGNVGIGTSGPNARLQVDSSSATYSANIRARNSNFGNGVVGAASGILTVATDMNNMAFYTASNLGVDGASAPTNERMRIDSSGNVGIGTASPAVKLDVNGIAGWSGSTTGQTAQIVGASSSMTGGGNFRVLSNTTQAVDVGGMLTLGGYYTSTTNSIDFGAILGAKENSTGGNTAGYLAFGTRPNSGNMTEAMRIDSSGQLILKRTAAVNSATLVCSAAQNTRAVSFVNNNNNNEVGYIFLNNDGTTTQYATTSDYRLKENVTPMLGALSVVAQLKPVTYKWKINGSDGQGFIAHELQAVVPDCVTGEKDGVEIYTDVDGNEQTIPKHQGIDTSFLVATLTAAIQELKAIIDTQATRIAALEAK